TKRFPDFDPKSQKFCTRLPDAPQITPVATQRTTKTTQNTQVAKQTKNLAQQEQISKKIQVPENKTWFPVYISDDAFKKQTHLIYNTELEQRILLPNSQGYANYDLCLFDCLSQIAVIRKTIYYYNKNGIIRENYEKTLHIIDCSCGIEYKKAQYLSSVKYDPATHALYINNKNSNYIIDADGAQFPITYTPRNLKTIEAMDKNKQTIIIINDTATTHNNFVIKPLQKAAQQIKLIQDLILAAHKQSQNPQPEQIPETTEKLFVFQDKVHQSLNNTYYNIYINDKRILSNCIDADIELLLSNKIMAIKHFVDGKKHIEIYNDTEQSLIPVQIDKYTKKYTYATDYSLTDKGIRLNMSNNTVTNIPFDKLNLPNKDYAFVITTQKHK
ncbi:MAG: hypothetical protein UIH99_03140, partial [Alphaproteobacteria bacterium]|nr:hypothetical protein [Alphaproteobacteria bacterium]